MACKITYLGEEQTTRLAPLRLNLRTLAKAWALSFLNCFVKSANALTYLRTEKAAGGPVYKVFSCQLSGNYANGGAIGVAGETLVFNSAGYTGRPSRRFLPSTVNGSTSALPAQSDFLLSFVPNGYEAQIEVNAANPTANNYVMRIFAAGSGNAAPVELTTGAYAAALTSAPIIIKVRVPLKYA